MSNPLASAQYVLAAHLPRQLPADGGREVAFAGRSNAGKSSALNAMTGQNKLARTSKTPGRTQQLVYFGVQPDRWLVDLPGYGYAKVPPDLREHWKTFINGYFRERQALAGLVVVMDIRHPLREFDQQMLAYAAARGLPAHCLLTKADKLSRGAQGTTLLQVRREVHAEYGEATSVQLFSAPSRIGVDELRGVVAGWLELGAPVAPTAPA
ncbi:ribosome biogenesis GTP-binding protein YihA/YsxC [Coralloluteibacterium stylophorae]|uniref:Probable GTP-binding protein EngB n=1 Tax=Coralloluteibacterium stylophorae TaxID=1776034 RepID=A0A8J8AZ01_9GAMM|nr:ribosome biogenesis GTP-binding protein YihA/YsxC [Coralloluteibacterium stylophorae]MBS7458033.1 ribosome biogenesis GTP-binding protein YihA/YsxC [Coralloluteibacterium stylophorae]